MAFLDHFEGRKSLRRLIVIIQLPGQVRQDEEADNDRADHPYRAFALEETLCP